MNFASQNKNLIANTFKQKFIPYNKKGLSVELMTVNKLFSKLVVVVVSFLYFFKSLILPASVPAFLGF